MVELYVDGVDTGKKIEFKQWKFPGGEIGVKINTETLPGKVTFASIKISGLHNLEDIMVALQLHDAMNRLFPNVLMNLAIHYFPYGRQDRACHLGEAFALEVFVKMLTCVHWNVIGIIDPHSDETIRLLKEYDADLIIGLQVSALDKLRDKYKIEYDCLIAPDAGAAKKMENQGIHISDNVFTMTKTRYEGGLSHAALDNDIISGKILVVDDICDGGATFISVATRIKESQPRVTQLDLYVTHGIFSKGVDELLKHYDNIYCYNMLSTDANTISRVYSK